MCTLSLLMRKTCTRLPDMWERTPVLKREPHFGARKVILREFGIARNRAMKLGTETPLLTRHAVSSCPGYPNGKTDLFLSVELSQRKGTKQLGLGTNSLRHVAIDLRRQVIRHLRRHAAHHATKRISLCGRQATVLLPMCQNWDMDPTIVFDPRLP